MKTSVDAWFLAPGERGNPATSLRPWTEGNDVVALVEGATYYRRLVEVFAGLQAGDWLHFTDWRGDDDERLLGPGTEIGVVLADLARRGVLVRGLFWRSHLLQFGESENTHFSERVNEAGGEVLLDERVRRGGSHHQKLVVLRHPGRPAADMAFVGGIDLCHGRNDDSDHGGDPQPYPLDKRYGPRPPWHDVMVELHGPVVGDVARTFRERWDDPTPLDHANPVRAWIAHTVKEPRCPEPLPPMPDDPPPCGPHAVQVLRTYPRRRTPYPFAPRGERSIARAYGKAFGRARHLVYVEDQYLWSADVAKVVAEALRSHGGLRLVAVVPRFPEADGPVTGPPSRLGQSEAVAMLRAAGGDRVAFYDLENLAGVPVYVHAKVCVVDDTWAAIGSDNMNRRSWTHDSELSCAVLDEEGRFARDLRIKLWREHLDIDDAEVSSVGDDPEAGFELFRRRAAALDDWHASGCAGERPRGRIRAHDPGELNALHRWWAGPAYRLLVDPDGRPRDLRREGRF